MADTQCDYLIRYTRVRTDGQVTGVQVLLACALTGIVQAVAGGQPLLIVGVAEPIVLIWGYMFHFAAGAMPLSLLNRPVVPTQTYYWFLLICKWKSCVSLTGVRACHVLCLIWTIGMRFC